MFHVFHIVQHWLAIYTGTDIPPNGSVWYNFWSGFGSDLGEGVIIGGGIQLYRKHNCHTQKCWRIAHHKFTDDTNGTEYMLCKKHYRQIHPEMPEIISIEHLLRIHRKNKKLK